MIAQVKSRLSFLLLFLLPFCGICTSTFHFLRISLLVFTAIIYLSTSRSRTVHLPFHSNCFALALLDSCRATQSVFLPSANILHPLPIINHNCNPKLVAPSLFPPASPTLPHHSMSRASSLGR
ncbi:hypothetical protein HOY80DRAFT_965871 [Tuber brumale]|nr:hypothetical protein HOY80DRAFT_965871 [Tuber brumale]